MTNPSTRNAGVTGLLAVILFCLVTSELLREGLSGPEITATAAAMIMLAGTELVLVGRRRRHQDPQGETPAVNTSQAEQRP